MGGAVVDEASQAAIVEALQSGAASGDPGPLRRIDTHLSRVFVGQDHAYKLSRARRHAFVDLSRPAQRRAAAEAELEANQALAPGLYQRVAALTRSDDGRIRIDGAGETVDWLVVMRPIPHGAIFGETRDAPPLSRGLAAELAEVVAAFHARLAPSEQGGGAADYARILAGLRTTQADGERASGTGPRAARLFDQLRARLDEIAPMIEARRRAGWVRRGHGDLHLSNICLLDGRITPFDALAFDPALATGDVLYDFGFLLMDLEARGLSAQANIAMNRYWDVSGQPEPALALLAFFMALRAAVRMAVLTEAGALDQADPYRRLALRLLRRPQPRLLAIGGLSGTGKSALAREIATRLPGACGARVLRTDVIRKALAGVRPDQRLTSAAYAAAARTEVYRTLRRRAGEALRAGASVVADATFQSASERRAIAAAAGAAAFAGLWLQAETAVRLARIAARRRDASDITEAAAARQAEPRTIAPPWCRIDAGRPARAVADAVARDLRAAWIAAG